MRFVLLKIVICIMFIKYIKGFYERLMGFKIKIVFKLKNIWYKKIIGISENLNNYIYVEGIIYKNVYLLYIIKFLKWYLKCNYYK